MKKLKDNWKILDRISLNILSVDFCLNESSESILLNTSFEELSKGRCFIKITKVKKNVLNTIFIYSDKALMNLEIFYTNDIFNKVFYLLNSKTIRKNKLLISLSKGLSVNHEGVLFARENMKIKVLDVEWMLPIL